MKLGTQSRWIRYIINMIWMTFRSGCSPAFYRITILINFTSYKNVTESFFKIKRISRKWWSPFTMLETLKVLRKWWSPFSVLKTLRSVRQWWSSLWVLKTLRVVREWLWEFFFGGHASLSFHMMIKFPGATFSPSVPTEFLWL